MDIVEKLRTYKRDRSGYAEYCHQAADEIERLRMALHDAGVGFGLTYDVHYVRGDLYDDLRTALTELRDRIKAHPAYCDLTEDEEIETGGDTAELSYLARVADASLGS